MTKRNWLSIIGVITIFLLITGCSDSKSTPETKVQEQAQQGTDSKEDKLESDTDLAKQLETEEGIDSVMVQVVEGERPAVNVDIVINDKQVLSPDEVIKKYGKVIKEKYPDRTLDLIVAKQGKLLKQETIK
ncbi:hypothetical protein DP73_02995 [Desulfosporosinus sp. HMP52]|uniref:hypothetical protein n=1 Tax=Desulfosporosinus sp. HMP52 TaxID=1487923 RepID=UPI00051FB323|nr:hypothetical protein [Desulfosporosinus sp. HMP52]KGK91562.1 hypothetical protein DP73_02995 [Desulfosporosinus sp. HMP52]